MASMSSFMEKPRMSPRNCSIGAELSGEAVRCVEKTCLAATGLRSKIPPGWPIQPFVEGQYPKGDRSATIK